MLSIMYIINPKDLNNLWTKIKKATYRYNS